MSYHTGDTICAVASPTGGAVRGIVRISGPDAVAIAGKLFTPEHDGLVSHARQAMVFPGRLRIMQGEGCEMPCDLFLWPTDRSYTREPVAELHTVGSPPLLNAIISEICAAGARLAEPGEFTLRAFLAGRLDLTQAEAVLGVIDAQDDRDLNVALQQLAGGLAQPLHRIRDDLLQLLAELEAGLDFVEEDIRFISIDEVTRRLSSAAEELSTVAHQLQSRHHAMVEQQIVLIGKPNAGKSSLFNTLVEQYGERRDTTANGTAPALVSPLSGTTRDYLTATVVLEGVRCLLIDTAGMEADELTSRNEIESKAQHLSGEQRQRATIRAYCAAVSDMIDSPALDRCDLLIWTKSDLGGVPPVPSDAFSESIVTSSVSGGGIAEAASKLGKLLTRSTESTGVHSVAATAQRCGASIEAAAEAVAKAATLAEANAGDELIAVDIRAAVEEIGKVVGAIYTDDLLDRIFKTFCIGK